MKHPNPTRKDHEAFCTIEGWTRRKTSTGKTGTHHINYEYVFPDGTVLITRISHPVNKQTYGKDMWKHILRDQLQVTEEEFWDCVKNQVLPQRNVAPNPTPTAVPLGVILRLRKVYNVPEGNLKQLSKEQALDLLGKLDSGFVL